MGKERAALALLAAAALVAMGILIWQAQRRLLAVTGRPSAAEAVLWDAQFAAAREVHLNTAGIAELERLPRIGPNLARQIIKYRATHGRFKTTEELMRVPGIGPKTFDAIREYVSVR